MKAYINLNGRTAVAFKHTYIMYGLYVKIVRLVRLCLQDIILTHPKLSVAVKQKMLAPCCKDGVHVTLM